MTLTRELSTTSAPPELKALMLSAAATIDTQAMQIKALTKIATAFMNLVDMGDFRYDGNIPSNIFTVSVDVGIEQSPFTSGYDTLMQAIEAIADSAPEITPPGALNHRGQP